MRRWIVLVAFAWGCAQGKLPPGTGGGLPDAGFTTPDAPLSAPDAFELRPDAFQIPPDAAVPDAFAADGPCVDTGAVCDSGNPGVCASGHQHCVSGVPQCVPDQTTQTCYDGPPGSAGTGACAAGTQSCIGGLGACVGEVIPSTENCFNSLDDDCNNAVNDGCPDHIVVGSNYNLAPEGGSGGGAVSAICPAGQIVGRVQQWFDYADGQATGVDIFCVTPTLVRGASAYSISTTAPGSSTAHFYGATKNSPPDGDLTCSSSGGAAALWETWTEAGQYVDGLGGACGTASATLDSFNDLTISVGYNGAQDALSYSKYTPAWQACNADSFVVGYQGRTGTFLDQITPVCAPIYVYYQ